MREEVREQRLARKRKKEKKRLILKSALAIILSVLLVGMAIAPIFAETTEEVTEDYEAFISFMLGRIEKDYYKDASKRDMLDGAYKGLFRSLDPYSTYFTPEEFAKFNEYTEGTFTGIGASIVESASGYIQIVAPIRRSPAEAAGLLPNDEIIKIDGKDINGYSSEQAVAEIRGKEGTDVTLTIYRDGETFDVTITRAVIEVLTVSYEILDGGIGYIELTGFKEITSKEFDEAMAYMVNHDVKKLIVDVRYNPGGLLDVAIHLSDYFIEKGDPIVKIDYKSAKDITYKATRAKAPMDLVVLVNEGSASASEVFAGSVQANGAGTVIGANSFGKGTVQTLVPLNTGGGLKMTIAEYLLKDDTHVHGVGIKPDIEVGKLYPKQGLAPLNPSVGANSLNVFAAQQRLQKLGYEVKPDGSYTAQTREAVLAFKKAQGLGDNSVLDVKTLEKLEQMVMRPDEVQLEAAIKFLKNR